VKLIGIADLHINERDRAGEGAAIREWMIKTLPDLEPDAYLIGGDLLHGRSSVAERNAAMSLLRPLSDNAEVIGVYGNHEVPHDLAIYNAIPSVHFYMGPTVHMLDGCAVPCLPWLRYVPSAGETSLPASALADATQRFVQGQLEALRLDLEALAPTMPRVMLGHAMIRGAKTALGQPVPLGAEFELGLEDLAPFNCDAYLFGHVHKGQDFIVGDGAPLIYPGSSHRTTYGEIDEKRVVILTIEAGRVDVEYLATPARPMLLCERDWSAGGWDDNEGVYALLDDVKACKLAPEVRFRYTVPSSCREAGSIAAGRVGARLKEAGAFSVKLEAKTIVETAPRAPEITRAPNVEGQLRVLFARQGRDEQTIARILSRLPVLQQKEAAR
jgi:DNA repair exonuclease SbcCD nuclease subunit